MRILFLTSRLPYPPHRGDRLRAFNFLRSLSRDHQIDLISFYANDSERDYLEPLSSYCHTVKTVQMSMTQSIIATGLNIWRRQPLQTLYYYSRSMQQLIDQALEGIHYDVIYVHLFRMAPYVSHHNHLYRVVDMTDLISKEVAHSLPYRGFFSRLLYSFEKPRIERYERFLANKFEEIWLISKADHQTLAKKCPNANIQVVSNGVDTEAFYPIHQSNDHDPETRNQIIFVGHMSVYHNVDAAVYLVNEILPLIWHEIPEVTLKLVGARPSPRIWALNEHPQVSVTGFIEDLNSALNQASVFVAPLRFAAGVQNKVLEAMAAGLPVVTTPLVNQGLDAKPGFELEVGDDPQTIATKVVNLLRDPSKCLKIGNEARQFVGMNFHWDVVRDRMNDIEAKLGRNERR